MLNFEYRNIDSLTVCDFVANKYLYNIRHVLGAKNMTVGFLYLYLILPKSSKKMNSFRLKILRFEVCPCC